MTKKQMVVKIREMAIETGLNVTDSYINNYYFQVKDSTTLGLEKWIHEMIYDQLVKEVIKQDQEA